MLCWHSTLECSALPVVDASGSYRGMVSRADLVAALGQQVRPPVVGGMATPLGVWLTTGSLSGGAPPLGLFLSGATLAFCFFVAHYGLLLTLQYFNPSGP
jgi:CBS domain-containing protein